MPSSNKSFTLAKAIAKLKAGRGSGDRESYRGMTETLEFSSAGQQSLDYFPEVGHELHLPSLGQLMHFLLTAWRFARPGSGEPLMLLDYKQERPIPREVSQAAALALGIPHPRYKGDREHTIITLDAQLDLVDQEDRVISSAWEVKRDANLESPHTRRKIALQRASSELLDMPFFVFRPEQVPAAHFVAVRAAYDALDRTNLDPHCYVESGLRRGVVLDELRTFHNKQPRKAQAMFVSEFGQFVDRRSNWNPGQAMRVMLQLAWRCEIGWDWFPRRCYSQQPVPTIKAAH